jgi:hypothetical protein
MRCEPEEESEEEEDSGEKPVISLPGHTAPPINYEGPEFPVRSLPPIHDVEPEPSDELAAKIRRADQLQTEVVDWLVGVIFAFVMTPWDRIFPALLRCSSLLNAAILIKLSNYMHIIYVFSYCFVADFQAWCWKFVTN